MRVRIESGLFTLDVQGPSGNADVSTWERARLDQLFLGLAAVVAAVMQEDGWDAPAPRELELPSRSVVRPGAAARWGG